MTRTLVLVTVLSVLAGCVTMSPDAEQVQVVYNALEIDPACASLGVVHGEDGFWRDGQGFENAERLMRAETAAMGGNVLLPISQRGSTLTGVRSLGQAYRCP